MSINSLFSPNDFMIHCDTVDAKNVIGADTIYTASSSLIDNRVVDLAGYSLDLGVGGNISMTDTLTTVNQNIDINQNISLKGPVFDSTSSAGLSNQVLTTDGANVTWTHIPISNIYTIDGIVADPVRQVQLSGNALALGQIGMVSPALIYIDHGNSNIAIKSDGGQVDLGNLTQLITNIESQQVNIGSNIDMGNTKFSGQIQDTLGNAGTNDQYLASDGSNVTWTNLPKLLIATVTANGNAPTSSTSILNLNVTGNYITYGAYTGFSNPNGDFIFQAGVTPLTYTGTISRTFVCSLSFSCITSVPADTYSIAVLVGGIPFRYSRLTLSTNADIFSYSWTLTLNTNDTIQWAMSNLTGTSLVTINASDMSLMG